MHKYILLIFLGATCMLRCMELVTEESLFKNRVNYKEYEHAVLKMSKAARRDCNFEYIQELVCEMNKNQPIDEIIIKFRNRKKDAIDCSENVDEYKSKSQVNIQRIIPKRMQDFEFERLLYQNNIKMPDNPAFVREIVACASVDLLKVLKKQVNFDDPELLQVALKTNELTRINFVLDQQKNKDQLSEFYPDILKLIFPKSFCNYPKNYKLGIPKKLSLDDKEREVVKTMYTHLLNVRAEVIRPLENFIIDFDDDIQQLQKVKMALEQCNKEAIDTILKDEKIISVLVNKYPKFVEGLIRQSNSWKKIEKAFEEYEWYAHTQLGRNSSYLGLAGGLYNARNIIANSSFNYVLTVGGILSLAWAAKKFYVYFKERNKNYLNAQTIVNSYKPVFYLSGYLQGREGKPSQEKENLQEQYYEENIHHRKWFDEAIFLMLGPVLFTIPTTIALFPRLETSSREELAATCLPGLIFMLLGLGKIMTESRDSTYFFITNNNSADLFRCVHKRGQRAGYAKYAEINGIQDQPKNEQNSPEPIPFRGFFGNIATYSKNLVAGFVSYIPKYQIRKDSNLR